MTNAVSSSSITRAVIYCRVSSDQAKGRSVEEQEKECREECERRGWPVAEVLIDNDRSASRFATKERPEYRRLRDILRSGDVLVTWEASRAQRDMARYVELRDLCAERDVRWSYSGKLFDLNEGDDRFSTGIDALLAEREAEDIRKRNLRAQRANLEAGKPHGRAIYGYRIVRDPDTGRAIGREPHPVQAPLVAEAARRLLAGHTLGSVVRWLEKQDPIGWNNAKLKRIVTNPTTAGYRASGGQIHTKGTWDGIISDEQLNDLIALSAARKTGPRGVKVKHLLSGIARCAACDKALVRKLGGFNKKTKSRYEVLACPQHHVGRSMSAIDAAVTDAIEDILSTPELTAAFARQSENTPDVKAQDQLRELTERLAAVEEKIIDGSMPPDTGARVATKIAKQIEEATIATATVYVSPTIGSVLNAADPFAEWKALPIADKREFIRATMRITVATVGKGRWHDPRDGIIVEPIRR